MWIGVLWSRRDRAKVTIASVSQIKLDLDHEAGSLPVDEPYLKYLIAYVVIIIPKGMEKPSLIESFIRDISVSGALLDKRGHIIEVSEGWKQFAEAANLKMENYAVGQDYLKHAVFPDPSSIVILRGLKRLLNKDIDVFSTIYPCDTPTQQRWFALVGFSVGDGSGAAAAVLHVDISGFLQDKTAVSASMIGVGAAALDPTIERLTRAVKEAVFASTSNSHANSQSTGDSRERRVIRSLTPHQLVLLAHLARGASNSEIAKSQNISIGSVKNQTTALLRKLGVTNRTQAALLAVRNRIHDGTG